MAKSVVVLKENCQKVYKNQLDEILKEAEVVAKDYVKYRWGSDVWAALESDYKTQSDFSVSREDSKGGAKNKNQEIKYVDLGVFNRILRNAEHSPLNSKKSSLYSGVWKNPNKSIKNSFEQLKASIRQPKSKMPEVQLIKNDISNIMDRSVDEIDLKKNLNSYMWLCVEENPQESLLSVDLKTFGVEGYLSTLKFAFEDFNANDYSFIVYMVVLLEKRNHLVHSRKDEFLPLASYNKDSDVIIKCITNILCLMCNVCHSDAKKLKEVKEIELKVQEKIEAILRSTSYDKEKVTVFREAVSELMLSTSGENFKRFCSKLYFVCITDAIIYRRELSNATPN